MHYFFQHVFFSTCILKKYMLNTSKPTSGYMHFLRIHVGTCQQECMLKKAHVENNSIIMYLEKMYRFNWLALERAPLRSQYLTYYDRRHGCKWIEEGWGEYLCFSTAQSTSFLFWRLAWCQRCSGAHSPRRNFLAFQLKCLACPQDRLCVGRKGRNCARTRSR